MVLVYLLYDLVASWQEQATAYTLTFQSKDLNGG